MHFPQEMKLIRDRYSMNYQGRKETINILILLLKAKPKKIPPNGEIVSLTSSEKITFLYVSIKTYE